MGLQVAWGDVCVLGAVAFATDMEVEALECLVGDLLERVVGVFGDEVLLEEE